MPGLSRRPASPPLILLVLAFAAVAAVLWLLPLFSTHAILFPNGPNFEDIIVYKGRFTLFHSAKFFTSRAYSGFAYPAGAAPIYALFYSVADPIKTYLLLAFALTVSALGGTLIFLRHHAATRLFLPLLLFSFPLVFLIQRANIELFLWVIIALGILAYRRNLPFVAAILFGFAAAIKLYPILLLGLFLKPASTRSRRDLPAFATGIVTAIGATLAAIAYAGPTLAIATHGFINGVDRFQARSVDAVSLVEISFDHCLFSPFKDLAHHWHVSPGPWRPVYYLSAAALALLLFLRVHRLPFLNRIIFLVAAMVCLPPVSFTYSLVHLYLPMLLLLGSLTMRKVSPSPTALAALSLLLFLMLPIVSLRVFMPLPSGPVQSVALLALMLLCAYQPWPDPATAPTL